MHSSYKVSIEKGAVMGRSFFKQNLASSVREKKTAPDVPVTSIAQNPPEKPVEASEPKEEAETDGVKKTGAEEAEAVYGDVEVCAALRIERFKLAEARKMARRGVDWECVGEHAGMTDNWVLAAAQERGIPMADIMRMKPIITGDGVVSCKVVGVWPNLERVTVEVVATGVREVAQVPRIDRSGMRLNDVFDARRFGASLAWVSDLNNAVYYRTKI